MFQFHKTSQSDKGYAGYACCSAEADFKELSSAWTCARRIKTDSDRIWKQKNVKQMEHDGTWWNTMEHNCVPKSRKDTEQTRAAVLFNRLSCHHVSPYNGRVQTCAIWVLLSSKDCDMLFKPRKTSQTRITLAEMRNTMKYIKILLCTLRQPELAQKSTPKRPKPLSCGSQTDRDHRVFLPRNFPFRQSSCCYLQRVSRLLRLDFSPGCH